jgi:ABC-type multidrug transport system permease subunit
MVSPQITSMLVMAVLAVIVIAALARSRRWHSHQPGATDDGGTGWSPGGYEAESLLTGTSVWIGLFLVLAVGAVAGVALFVSSSAAPSGLLAGPIVLVSALFVGLYVVLGVYVTAKARGHPSSMAAAETATVGGALFLIAVASQLIGA